MNLNEQRPTVLIIDDVPTNVQILAEALSPLYRIKVASSGTSALEIAQRKPHPDIILLDVMMPEMDGFEVCRRLKSNNETSNIPVIFVTAKNTESDEELGLNLGAVDYITKPFSIPITKARIRNHLRLKHQADLLESLSMIDALTQIPNRRNFDATLLSEWKQAARNHSMLTVIIIDIDYFKQYNDHYGHGAGDVCLQMVASALSKDIIRPSDMVARYGGEEFIVILPETTEEEATLVAERLRTSVENLAIPHEYSSTAPVVTISAGIASHRNQGDNSIQNLIDAADKALYMAKASGRNQVCKANPMIIQ